MTRDRSDDWFWSPRILDRRSGLRDDNCSAGRCPQARPITKLLFAKGSLLAPRCHVGRLPAHAFEAGESRGTLPVPWIANVRDHWRARLHERPGCAERNQLRDILGHASLATTSRQRRAPPTRNQSPPRAMRLAADRPTPAGFSGHVCPHSDDADSTLGERRCSYRRRHRTTPITCPNRASSERDVQ